MINDQSTIKFYLLPFIFPSYTQYLCHLVVKADTAMVRIPELDFEIPPNTQKGSVSTVEGLIWQSAERLEEGQPERRV